ncbi:MAG: VOC family protein [Phycisphaerae bacterium]|nr:VOC family protein [Phycisphaerae bacterium]
MANPLCHFEFLTNDPEKCKAFYSKVFDWEFQTPPGHPHYTLIATGSEPGGGMMKKPDECPAPTVGIYIAVDNVEETLAKVTGAGGRVVMPKTPIPGVGAIAVFIDPENIGIGILQPERSSG